jgi:polyhydroxyalkanoate synthesis regulator phasin
MIDPLKKTVLVGLGIVSFTKEKLTRLVNDLAERGEISRDQASTVLDTLLSRGDTMVENGDHRGRKVVRSVLDGVERVLKSAPFVTRDEYLKLRARVDALEVVDGSPDDEPTSPPSSDDVEESA